MSHTPLPKIFGRRLRFLRTMAGMTQARLAEHSGISIDHLSKIERGLSSPSFAVIARLASVMGVRPASLFHDGTQQQSDHKAPDGTGTYLRELNHRIKNSYAILASLADLSSMDARCKEARDRCRDITAKIRHMALLHDLLSCRNMDDTMHLGDYLQRIFHQLANLHPGPRRLLRIRADEVLLPARKALPFGLAAFELLTNTYKHADGADVVRIQVKDNGRDAVTVILSDNGPGLTIPAAEGESEGGRGLSLVRTLVEDQLKGTFRLRTNGGTEASLSFRVTD